MSPSLRPPLFVKPDEPLFVFRNPDRARKVLEWQDLQDDGYRGYDSDGRPFVLEAVTHERKFLGFASYRQNEVRLRVLEEQTRPEELRELLMSALSSAESTPLEELHRFSLTERQMKAIAVYGLD